MPKKVTDIKDKQKKKAEPPLPQDAEANIAMSMEEMAAAIAKDRGCCFNVFYHVTKKMTHHLERQTVVCGKCRVEWLIERLGLAIILLPLGVRPLVVPAGPGDMPKGA